MDVLTGYIEDLEATKEAIYISFGVAFIMGYNINIFNRIIYLFLTRALAGILVWLSIFLFLIGLGFGTYWCH